MFQGWPRSPHQLPLSTDESCHHVWCSQGTAQRICGHEWRKDPSVWKLQDQTPELPSPNQSGQPGKHEYQLASRLFLGGRLINWTSLACSGTNHWLNPPKAVWLMYGIPSTWMHLQLSQVAYRVSQAPSRWGTVSKKPRPVLIADCKVHVATAVLHPQIGRSPFWTRLTIPGRWTSYGEYRSWQYKQIILQPKRFRVCLSEPLPQNGWIHFLSN